MKIGKIGWVIIVIGILSGWIAFGITWAVTKEQTKGFESEMVDLQVQLRYLNLLLKEIDKSSQNINKMAKTIKELKKEVENIEKEKEKK